MENEYVLYILMNCDLTSMNSGKAIAQGSHASAMFTKKCIQPGNGDLKKAYDHWSAEGYGYFGTTLVLESSEKQIKDFMFAKALFLDAEPVVDETYPFLVDKELGGLVDKSILTSDPVGKGDNVLLTRRQRTCAYFFMKSDCPAREMFKGLELY